jgi:hypothetical protein
LTNKFPGHDIIKIVYDGTTDPFSPARKLIVDFFIYAGDEKWFKDKNYG